MNSARRSIHFEERHQPSVFNLPRKRLRSNPPKLRDEQPCEIQRFSPSRELAPRKVALLKRPRTDCLSRRSVHLWPWIKQMCTHASHFFLLPQVRFSHQQVAQENERTNEPNEIHSPRKDVPFPFDLTCESTSPQYAFL
jgi:hypothetical protein